MVSLIRYTLSLALLDVSDAAAEAPDGVVTGAMLAADCLLYTSPSPRDS